MMGTTSQYVLDRRADPSLMNQGDHDRLDKAKAKRARRALALARHNSATILSDNKTATNSGRGDT